MLPPRKTIPICKSLDPIFFVINPFGSVIKEEAVMPSSKAMAA